MPKRPPSGFHQRRSVARRFQWDADEAVAPNAERSPQSQSVNAQSVDAQSVKSQSVSVVAKHIRERLQTDPMLSGIWIEGEIRSFSRSGAGHYYFDLADTDGDSALACVFFRGSNRGMQVRQGDQVLVYGSADLYPARGSLQIIVDDLRPIGEGVLQAEFNRLFRQLGDEGLFNPDRKRPLPRYPQRIGVATSEHGAVWHDIQDVLGRRWPLAELLLAPCQVQGAGAAEDIANTIDAFNLLTHDRPDVLIVGRGGGSPEDLWAFNEEPVARAIFASDIPVVSAVGHETDVTIADHVADLRAPTPSAAAELTAPDRSEESARIAGFRQTFSQLLESRVSRLQLMHASFTERFERAAPDLASRQMDLNRAQGALDLELDRQLAVRGAELAARQQRLQALNPMATLNRGFTAITDDHGRIVTSARALQSDQPITIRFHDGEVDARTTADPVMTEDHARV